MKVKRKALVVTTVASTIDQFCMNDISILLDEYEVHVAANFYEGNNTTTQRVIEFISELKLKNIVINQIDFNRNPINKNNLKAYGDLKNIMELNAFDLIHCHTPIAAMLTRLAAKNARESNAEVLYTAHGFHFFNGAPFINWILFYTTEKWLARYTDVLITINKEDYARAKKSFKAKRVEYIPGIGIDTKKFREVIIDKSAKRVELKIPEDTIVLLSVGELNKNKNHETILQAIAKLNNSKIYYMICGQGILENYLSDLAIELGVEKQVKLLGYRKDVTEIIKVSDIFIFPSYREGLSVALMEVMALGLPVICSNIRGNVDLIEEGKGGNLVAPDDVEGFVKALEKLIKSEKLCKAFGKSNIDTVKKFDSDVVIEKMKKIYDSVDL